MRRSARRNTPAEKPSSAPRSDSPSTSEVTVTLASPAVSPTPDIPVRQHATPGQREDGQPKRPMNAFILFSNEKRGELADLNPHLSNAAVSVLLGQRWREMHANEKASYVANARRIKEDFHIAHPEAKHRTISRKGKRKRADGGGSGGKLARNMAPASLHALALVGSRLNQSPYDSYGEPSPGGAPYRRPSVFYRPHAKYADYDDEFEDEHEDAEDDDEATTTASVPAPGGLSLLEQLCTVVESEHTATVQMLSTSSTTC